MSKLHLKALTPDRTLLEEEVDYVLLRAYEGDMGILPGHQACTVLLADGVMRAYVEKKEVDSLMIVGGFATVQDDTVVILSSLAERPEKFEQMLADLEQQRLENAKIEEKSELEIQRAQTALRRALVGKEGSSYAILKGNEDQSTEKPEEKPGPDNEEE